MWSIALLSHASLQLSASEPGAHCFVVRRCFVELCTTLLPRRHKEQVARTIYAGNAVDRLHRPKLQNVINWTACTPGFESLLLRS